MIVSYTLTLLGWTCARPPLEATATLTRVVFNYSLVTLARTWLHNPQDHYMQSKIPSQLCLPRTYDLSYLFVCPTKPFHSHEEECRKIKVKNIRTLGSEIRIVHKLGLPCSSETINKDSHPRLSTLWGTKLVNLNEYRQRQIQLVRSSTSR